MSHIACPGAEVFERIEPLNIPNYSVRMSALTAACIRPQIKELPQRVAHANECYEMICNRLMDGAAKVRAEKPMCRLEFNATIPDLLSPRCRKRPSNVS